MSGYYRRPQKRYPKGRVCEGRNCRTVLSVYNPDHLCSLCDDSLVPA